MTSCINNMELSTNHDEVDEKEQTAVVVHKSTWEKPNLKGDWLNLFLLTLLYTMQGLPYSLTLSLSMILQSKQMVTYDEQGSFSFAVWPFNMKLLWAPIVDSLYIQWMGRRKSWFIPAQYLMGILFLYLAKNIDCWLPESGKPNIKMIGYVLFCINFMCATQDITVDGWALALLKKENVSYASVCNTVGMALGMFISSISVNLLASEKFCNEYMRITPDTGGIISIKSVLMFMGFWFLLITTLVGILKKEKDSGLEDGQIKISIIQNYKLIWYILKIPSMKVFMLILLTSWIGLSSTESVTNLKLIDAGVSNEIMMVTTGLYFLKFCVPLMLVKYVAGPKSISLLLKLIPIRLLWSLPFAFLFYFTPLIINNNGVVSIPVYYHIMIGFIFAINELLTYIILIAMGAFFSRISDPRIGGTYMTLLNTVRNLAYAIPNLTLLKTVDFLTFKKCSNNDQNSCATLDLKDMCNSNGGNCLTIVDGYYVEIVICLAIGFVWFGISRRILKDLQSKSRYHWMVELKLK